MVTASLFMTVKKLEQLKHPLADGKTDQTWHTIHTTVCYSVVTSNAALTHTVCHADEPWKHAQWEKSDTKDHRSSNVCKWKAQNREVHQSRKQIPGCQKPGKCKPRSEHGFGISGGQEDVLELPVVWLHSCECTNNHIIIHCKRVAFIACGLLGWKKISWWNPPP